MKIVLAALLGLSFAATGQEYELLGDDAKVVALDTQARTLGKGAMREGDVVHGFSPKMDWTTKLTPGVCYAILGRAGAGVKSVGISLFSPDGKRVAQSKAGSATMLRYCATWLGDYHVQTRADAPGTYLVATYAVSGKVTQASASPPPLVAAPAPYAPPAPVYQQPVYPPPQPVYVQPLYVQPVYAPQPRVIVVHERRGTDCTSSSDCETDQFCKDDGTGFKMCMGNNSRGDACNSTIDCADDLFCKEDSAGFKVCK